MASINYGELARTAKTEFEPLPIGEYDAHVQSATYKPSSKGDPMWNVCFVVDGGPHDGRKVWRNIVLTANSAGIFFDQMAMLGANADFFDTIQPGDEDRVCGQLVDAPCRLKIKHREWQGKIQNDVEKILPSSQRAAFASAGLTPSVSGSARPASPF